MTGEEKVAVLLLCLKEELAAQVMKNFDQMEVIRIGKAMTRIKKVTADELRNVAKEFCDTAREGAEVLPIKREALKSILLKVMDEKTANELLVKLMDTTTEENPILDKLRFIDPRFIIEYARGEHPQTVALILAHLRPADTAVIIEGFPPALQADIIKRMANLKGVSPEIVAEIADTLEKEVASIGGGGKELGGPKTVADILNTISRNAQQAILSQLEDDDPQMAAEVRDHMFSFDDVLQLDDRSIQEIIKEVGSADLAKAMKLVDESSRERIYRNMSKRAADILREEIQLMPPVRLSEVEAAQKTITDTARALEAKGLVMIQKGGGEKDAFV
jgi:flagellar motor switch protein FliG